MDVFPGLTPTGVLAGLSSPSSVTPQTVATGLVHVADDGFRFTSPADGALVFPQPFREKWLLTCGGDTRGDTSSSTTTHAMACRAYSANGVS